MVDPGIALAAGLAGLVAVALLLRRDGPLRRWRRALRLGERVRLEDTLKHLWDLEYRGHSASVASLAGTLEIPVRRAVEILARAEALGLTRTDDGAPRLTPQGRSYALRVVRNHRLWERWLAEETGWREIDWHRQAEVREHVTTPEEADALAERMGHPRYDPHGDPIPTATGDLPRFHGRPLPSLEEGASAAIVHLEDEPEAVYAQLVAEGLAPGMTIRVLEHGPERIRFAADGEECVLAPVLAANVTVVPAPPAPADGEPADTLDSLPPGRSARVVQLAPACRGMQRRRLLDLGLVPGTRVDAEMRATGGRPTAYRIRGALVALRPEQTRHVRIERLDGPAS
jgi:DtxR family Mn-dependent transcriptional regulator